MQKNFYAIIPAFIRYDKRLPMLSRFLYGELTALCNEKGYCWASNRYFAELYEVSIETISRYIAKLKEFGYIRITYDSSKKDNDRRIYITDIQIENIEPTTETKTETKAEAEEEYTTTPLTKTSNTLDENIKPPLTKTSNTLDENIKPPLTKTSNTLDENIKHNNTCNTTVNNTESDARAREQSCFEKFITDFLVYYQKLTGHAVSDINQAPFFRTFKNREELKSIFENRRYSYLPCLKQAFEFALKRPPDKRFFSFYDTLKIYLQNGNGGEIARYLSEAERQARLEAEKQKAEAEKNAELEKRRKEYNEAERIGLTVEEYRRMLEIEEQDLINNIRNNMLKVGIGI